MRHTLTQITNYFCGYLYGNFMKLDPEGGGGESENFVDMDRCNKVLLFNRAECIRARLVFI